MKCFFAHGEQISGVNYYFTRDHLGSVREMTDGSGTIQARYDYDPYGRRTKISGGLDADFAFTGDYYHAASGLYLTLFRAYDSDLGRWLSRDPLAEAMGLNLYAYVGNNPLNAIDLYGLSPNWGKAGLSLIGVGASLIGLVGGAASAETGVGLVVAIESAYSLVTNIQNLSNDLNGRDEVTTGLGKAIGEAVGGEGSDEAKAGETFDLETLFLNPGGDLTALQKAVQDADSINAAQVAINEAGNDTGLWNFLKQLIDPIVSSGCPAGSNSTGNDQNDVWNYISQLNRIEGLP